LLLPTTRMATISGRSLNALMSISAK
jgi:hypothetical protein